MEACEEIIAYFGVVIAMGKMNLPEVRDYWRKGMFNIPCFSQICTVTCFESIGRFLHLNDNKKTPEKTDSSYKLYKLGDLPHSLNISFKNDYHPSREISIDEQMTGMKAKLSSNQYMPKKPAEFGVKIWICCESLTGYCLKFQVYTGKVDGAAEKCLAHRACMDLGSPYLSK